MRGIGKESIEIKISKMDYAKSLVIIFLLIAVYFTSDTNGEDVCVKKGPCSCVFSNGTGIDLTPTNSTTFFTATNFAVKMEGKQFELSTYYYHPCKDLMPPVNKTSANDTCDKTLAVSRLITKLSFKFSRYLACLHS